MLGSQKTAFQRLGIQSHGKVLVWRHVSGSGFSPRHQTKAVLKTCGSFSSNKLHEPL
ncbi:hypothetical protein ACRRTK_011776 [Alexandromys fortis]